MAKHSAERRKNISKARRKQVRERLEQEGPHPDLKRCSKCGEWKKALSDFHWRKRRLKCGEVVLRCEPACKECRNSQNKKIRERELAEGVDIYARWRLWYYRRGPRYRKELMRKKREREAIKRRENGSLPRPRRKNVVHLQDRDLPAAPISKWLKEESIVGNKVDKEGLDKGILLAAEQTGVSDRRLGALLRGEQALVRLSTVDKILIGLDVPHVFHELYPEAD